jgi:membrane-bound ClpP family serine protease
VDILNIASVGFLVVFLGTLFLFGELLVKVKGLFAVIGIAIMYVYFSFHISGDVGFWVILLYLAGLTLIIVDGKALGDGTLAVLGVLLMIIGIAIPAPTLLYGALVSMGFLMGGFGALLFTKVFPSRNIWSKMTLKDQLSSEKGYNSINEGYHSLVGKKGITLTPFRPIGTIEIDNEHYSATSENIWIDSGVEIEVVSVDGTRIMVKPVNLKNK